MSANEEQPAQTKPPVDLADLQSLSFGPAWSASSNDAGKKTSRDFTEERSRSKEGGNNRPERKDRRVGAGTGKRAFNDSGAQSGGERSRGNRSESRSGSKSRSERGGGNRNARQEETFQPIAQVLFYPEDAPFEKLAKVIRSSCRTFELFELARLILEKEERFVLVIKPTDKSAHAPVKEFYCTVPDNIPFTSEEDAVNHVLEERLDQFCTKEEVETEAPKGSFPFVTKCPFTGTLIGPPNYHRYASLLREHHATHAARMPFDRYVEKLEKCSDEESITAWGQSMTRQTRYKITVEGKEPLEFDSLDSLKTHLLATRRADIVKQYETVRLPGSRIQKIPQGAIRKSIEHCKELQQRFPLDTANNLRGRLRRMKFHIYKRGSKGASYVCGVKRKFRDEQTRFGDSIQALVEFLDAHPETHIKDLPEQYLGITLAPQAAPEAKAAPPENTETTAEADSATPATAPTENASAPAAPQTMLSEADNKRIKQLMQDIRWLVSEGFVTEFGDGKLFAQPVLSSHQQKAMDESSDSSDDDEVDESTPDAEPASSTESVETTEQAASVSTPEETTEETSAAPEAEAQSSTPETSEETTRVEDPEAKQV